MRRKGLRKTLYHIVLWLVAIAFFLPVFWIILGALKTKDQLLAIPPKWLFVPSLANFVDLFTRPNITTYLINSVIISLSAVAIAIVVSFLAAYCFSNVLVALNSDGSFCCDGSGCLPDVCCFRLERYLAWDDFVLRYVQHPLLRMDLEGLH